MKKKVEDKEQEVKPEEPQVLCLYDEKDVPCIPVNRGAPQNDPQICELCIKYKSAAASDSSRMFKDLMPLLEKMAGTAGAITGRHYVPTPPEGSGILVGTLPPRAGQPRSPQEAVEMFMEQSTDEEKEETLSELEGAAKMPKHPNDIPLVTALNKLTLERLREWKAKKSKT
jgi:hypothetical protein